MYDLNSLDSHHKEALDRATNLLQIFMERQEKLRHMINGKIPFDESEPKWREGWGATAERNNNSLIITCIQWIRYHLWGNTKEEVAIKTGNRLYWWCWDNSASGPGVAPWAREVLGIDDCVLDDYGYTTYRKLMHRLLDIVIPKRTGGLFGMLDGDYGSITLEECVGKMRKEMKE